MGAAEGPALGAAVGEAVGLAVGLNVVAVVVTVVVCVVESHLRIPGGHTSVVPKTNTPHNPVSKF